MPERDKLDQILDSALVGYAEPRSGLEKRILTRVMARVEEERGVSLAPRRRWLVWAVAIPLTACIALYVAVSNVRQLNTNVVLEAPKHEKAASAPSLQGTQRETIHSVERSRAGAASKPILHRSAIVATNLVARPKLDVFPAPQPLSAQEQALVALVKQAPELQQEVLARANETDMPLQISAIQIPPISPPDEGKN